MTVIASGFFISLPSFGKDFVERDANADRKAKLAFGCCPDFFCRSDRVKAAAGEVKPALIHAIRLHSVCVPEIDFMGKPGILEILVVLGRYDDQITAAFFCLPDGHSGFHTSFLRQLGLRKYDAVPCLLTAADSYCFPAQGRVNIASTEA
jgi:hypothetical protein